MAKKKIKAERKTNIELCITEPEPVIVGKFVAEPTTDTTIEEPTYEIAAEVPIEEPKWEAAEVPIEEPTNQNTAEDVRLAEPMEEIMVEETAVESFTSCGPMLQQSRASPYTKPPVELLIGPDNIVHYVPRRLLPPGWSGCDSEKQWHLPDLNVETGHTLAHYLHTGSYETIDTQVDTPITKTFAKMKQALSVYFASTNCGLLGLQHLAMCEMKDNAVRMDFIQFLGSIREDFDKLGPESWVHGCLHKKAKDAFAEDHTAFRSEPFLENLEYPGVNKFMMKCVMEFHDNKVSEMLRRDKQTSENLGDCHEAIRVLSEKKDVSEQGVVTQQDFITPLADESTTSNCCGDETFQEDLVSDEDFCTISCPPSECPNELRECREEIKKCSTDTTEHSKDIDVARSMSNKQLRSSPRLASDLSIEISQTPTPCSAVKNCEREATGSWLASELRPSSNSVAPQSMTEKKESKKQKKMRERKELQEMRELWEMTRKERSNAAEGGNITPEPVDHSEHRNKVESVEAGPSWRADRASKPGRVDSRITVLRATLAALLDDFESTQPSPGI